jgi:hypothetical protein
LASRRYIKRALVQHFGQMSGEGDTEKDSLVDGACLSVCLSVCLSDCLCACLSVCLSVCLFHGFGSTNGAILSLLLDSLDSYVLKSSFVQNMTH